MVNRVPTEYIVTRKQKRYIARQKAAAAPHKEKNLFKHSYIVTKAGQERIPSIFSTKWKDYLQEGV